MNEFAHQRHKPPTALSRPRELTVAMPPMRSNVNVSRIVRLAGCCGLRRIVVCGRPKIDRKIARDAAEVLQIDIHRTLPPVLRQFRTDGYALVGLEQASGSQNLHEFAFPRRAVLVLGHEREGLDDEVLGLLDHAVEIPVYGLPYSFNVATAAAMALYEYCRQYPSG